MPKPMMVKDVYPEIARLLSLPPLRIRGKVTVHLACHDVVRVDIEGIIPTEVLNVTANVDEIETHANRP